MKIRHSLSILCILFCLAKGEIQAHSGYWGMASGTSGTFTNKGFGAMSLEGLLLLSWIDLGVEANIIAYPEHYNTPRQNVFNGIIRFNIYGVLYVHYLSSKHWQVAANIPVKFFRLRQDKAEEPAKFLGLLLAVDFPNVADVEYRYRLGATFTYLDGPDGRR